MSELIEIIKIKVKDNVPEINYKKHHEEDRSGDHTAKDPFLIHPDFQEALDGFKPHFAKLLDLREGDVIKKKIDNIHEEAFGNLKITGISISGTGDDFGACITGTKTVRGGKVVNMTTPFEMVFDEYSDYPFREQLNDCIQRVQFEAEEYLKGKHRIGQMSMDFEAQAEDME